MSIRVNGMEYDLAMCWIGGPQYVLNSPCPAAPASNNPHIYAHCQRQLRDLCHLRIGDCYECQPSNSPKQAHGHMMWDDFHPQPSWHLPSCPCFESFLNISMPMLVVRWQYCLKFSLCMKQIPVFDPKIYLYCPQKPPNRFPNLPTGPNRNDSGESPSPASIQPQDLSGTLGIYIYMYIYIYVHVCIQGGLSISKISQDQPKALDIIDKLCLIEFDWCFFGSTIYPLDILDHHNPWAGSHH